MPLTTLLHMEMGLKQKKTSNCTQATHIQVKTQRERKKNT